MPVSLVKSDGLDELHILRAAIEASGDIVYSWDLATDQMEWLGEAALVLGTGAGDLPPCGDRFNGRISPEDLPGRMRALSDHLTGTTIYDCEYRVRCSNGEFQWVHDRGGVEFSATGTPVRFSGTLRPVRLFQAAAVGGSHRKRGALSLPPLRRGRPGGGAAAPGTAAPARGHPPIPSTSLGTGGLAALGRFPR